MPTFVFQSDPVTLMEKRAVRHACALDDRFGIGQTMPLDLVASYLPGELRDYTPICPVGTVEFCRAWMRAVGVKEPAPIDYPECLRPALGRFIVTVPFEQARHGCWIKPVRTKAWEPHVMTAGEAIPVDERVWESAVIPEKDWIAEWRVYVLDGQIVGHGRYDDGPDESAVFDEGAAVLDRRLHRQRAGPKRIRARCRAAVRRTHDPGRSHGRLGHRLLQGHLRVCAVCRIAGGQVGRDRQIRLDVY